MKTIRMVDLKSQYEKIKEEVNFGIQEVIDSTAFIKGGKVVDFQQQMESYLGVKHVVPVGNGTDALQISLMVLGLKPGDEVIIPTFTFVATAEVAVLLGLTPVLVDVDTNFCLSIEAVKKAITPRTKAIVPVHLFGQNADMDSLMAIANEYNLFVVEDACQSIGSVYTFANGSTKFSGCMGNLGCTSFFPSKNLGCFGDGGAIFTNDDRLAAEIRSVANHGMKVRYHHDRVGVNSRLDSIQAAILGVKLKYLDQYIVSRQTAANFYDNDFDGCADVIIPQRNPYSTHVFHQYTLILNDIDRNALQSWLAEKGVPSMVYYPVPLHLQKAYQSERYRKGNFPVAEMLSASVLSLPMHTELDIEQLTFITTMVKEGIKANKRS
ncbi:MAG: DegT/DnrJ/EryC1/StrS aminotransferase [Bacteroidetes bacterium]|nr:DegT/DnrJ/EryC1/StrS aminotransferase [Bacteroidota bacterium]